MTHQVTCWIPLCISLCHPRKGETANQLSDTILTRFDECEKLKIQIRCWFLRFAWFLIAEKHCEITLYSSGADLVELMFTLIARFAFTPNDIIPLPCLNSATDIIALANEALQVVFRKPVVVTVGK